MIHVGIVGDGYTAAELLRLIASHPELEVVYISSHHNIGRRVDAVFPQLSGFYDLVFEPTDVEKIKASCDAVFLALPHGASVPLVQKLAAVGVRCVDMGADFRLKNPAVYEKYYGLVHSAPHMLADAVYGLPELYREQIQKAVFVANPGCYPTASILPLAPLLKNHLIESSQIIIDAKSGATGAGRNAKEANLYCEVNDSFKAYGVGTHRHMPEIAQELSLAAGLPVDMIFTPHLVPMSRGILATIYAMRTPQAAPGDIRNALEQAYAQEPFVQVLADGVFPQTKWVYGSNQVQIGVWTDPGSRRVVLVSAVDNLTKGASGQALQNLNLMLGIEETTALSMPGLMP